MRSSHDFASVEAYMSGIECGEGATVVSCEARLPLRQACAPAAPGILDAAQDLSTSWI